MLVHGFDSHPDIWRGTERVLREAGRTSVLIHWRPPVPGARSRETAVSVLLPAIGDGLEAAGYPRDAPFDVVTHSMGGLLMRLLLEHTDLHGDPTLPARVGSLAMLSPPHQGARTGIAGIACGTYRDPLWRDIVCDLKAGSALLERLGSTKPEGVPTRYLSIGVATGAPFIPVPLYDGDGDGRPAGHDNAVMAESGALPGEGSAFVIWRGWDRHDHFSASCFRDREPVGPGLRGPGRRADPGEGQGEGWGRLQRGEQERLACGSRLRVTATEDRYTPAMTDVVLRRLGHGDEAPSPPLLARASGARPVPTRLGRPPRHRPCRQAAGTCSGRFCGDRLTGVFLQSQTLLIASASDEAVAAFALHVAATLEDEPVTEVLGPAGMVEPFFAAFSIASADRASGSPLPPRSPAPRAARRGPRCPAGA